MKNGIIYIAFCESENKCYIGQTTKNISTRKREHFYSARKGSSSYFHRALLKYSFSFSILEKAENLDLLNEKERFWIDSYKSNDLNFGYNIQKGGRYQKSSKNKLTKHKPETIEKIRTSLIGSNNPMFGKSVYDRWVELYGIEIADEKMIEYINKHKMSHKGEKNGMFGKTQKDETKKIISDKAKMRTGKIASRYISIDEGLLTSLINEGLSIKEMSIILDKSEYVIRKRIKEIN